MNTGILLPILAIVTGAGIIVTVLRRALRRPPPLSDLVLAVGIERATFDPPLIGWRR